MACMGSLGDPAGDLDDLEHRRDERGAQEYGPGRGHLPAGRPVKMEPVFAPSGSSGPARLTSHDLDDGRRRGAAWRCRRRRRTPATLAFARGAQLVCSGALPSTTNYAPEVSA
jgi:hypothetical protein